MPTPKVILSILFCLIIVSACGADEPSEQEIAAFSFIDQNGEPFGTDDLAGSVCVANCIFTECDTVCPQMSVEMATLQQALAENDIEVELVSFTVDPEVDSPDVLKEYMTKFTDDASNWHMLTGYSQEDIEAFAKEQFQTIVQKPSSSDQVIHGTNFYLIDQDGVIQNQYNYTDASYIENMIEDIRSLQ